MKKSDDINKPDYKERIENANQHIQLLKIQSIIIKNASIQSNDLLREPDLTAARDTYKIDKNIPDDIAKIIVKIYETDDLKTKLYKTAKNIENDLANADNFYRQELLDNNQSIDNAEYK